MTVRFGLCISCLMQAAKINLSGAIMADKRKTNDNNTELAKLDKVISSVKQSQKAYAKFHQEQVEHLLPKHRL